MNGKLFRRISGPIGAPPLIAGLVLGILPSVPIASGQSPAPMAFEVISIKRSAGGQVMLGRTSPGTFSTSNFPLKGLIMEAYGVRAFQVTGVPGALGDERFDIQAKYDASLDGGISAEQQQKDMTLRIQRLLEDRFALKAHREAKPLPVYVLSTAKGGNKLQESKCTDPNGPRSEAAAGGPSPVSCESRYGNKGNNRTLDWTGATVEDFVHFALPNILGRPVIDKTGLLGKFDLHLEWTPDQATSGITGANPERQGAPASPDNPNAISIFSAVQEQMGLRLESGRAPVDVVAVEHLEMPSDN